jgi:GABA(A) receptor-associated protein
MFLSFKQHSLYLRKEQSTRLKIKFPERIPIILEKYHGSTNAPDIDKNKYLVPKDATVGTFVHVIRKRLKMSDRQALFLFCSSTIPPVYELMSQVYEQHKDDDGFLYMSYTTENTFGNCLTSLKII